MIMELAMVLCRGIGPWGPALVRKYAGVRFGTYASGNMLNEQESKLFSGWPFLSLLVLLRPYNFPIAVVPL